MNIIYYSDFMTEYVKMYLAVKDGKVVKINFGNKSELTNWLKKHYPTWEYKNISSRTKPFSKKIQSYLKGNTKKIDLPFEITSSGFHRRVLTALKRIPYGKTVSYKELARRAGNISASRAAGTACANNPLPLVIPCHRVVTSDGKLGGFAGGLKLKRKLLENEGVTGIRK